MALKEEDNNMQVLVLLGEIKGELSGIHRLVQQSTEATTQRIDDLRDSMHRRLEDHQAHNEQRFGQFSEDVDRRFNDVDKRTTKRSVATGGSAGALVLGLSEIVKAIFSG